MIRLRRRICYGQGLFGLASVGLLGAILISALEPIVGLVNDGDVHHESALVAASHSGSTPAQHAHEDLRHQSSDGKHDGHEHGSAADHCTHAHGALLRATQSLAFVSVERPMESLEIARGRSVTSSSPRHPPRL
ncbi:MAG: DUF2946 family protein [Gemmatimonadales bacterium]